jgi:hypothetical protein
MAETILKYKINEQIETLPRQISIAEVVTLLERNGIPRHTFFRDRKIEIDSESSIPTDRLQIYAKFFDCQLEDLLNTQVNVKSIRAQISKTKSGKFKTGLS